MVYVINGDGDMRPVVTNNNLYLVTFRMEDELYTETQTARQIFEKMDMSDCYEISIENLYLIRENGRVSECEFRGTWHDGRDPLKMAIVLKRGKRIVDEGWGSDH